MAALHGADAVVNLVGILVETGTQKFSSLHVQGARIVAEAAKALGITKFRANSGIGADPQSASDDGRTKAEGEVAVLENIPSAVIIVHQ